MAEFVEKYISDCISGGTCAFNDIAKKARSRIVDIDKEIQKLAELRQEKSNLLLVIKQIDPDGSIRRKRTSVSSAEVPKVDEDELTELVSTVYQTIVDNGGPILPRHLVERVGYATQDPTPVYSAIKILTDGCRIGRTEDRKIYIITPEEERTDV